MSTRLQEDYDKTLGQSPCLTGCSKVLKDIDVVSVFIKRVISRKKQVILDQTLHHRYPPRKTTEKFYLLTDFRFFLRVLGDDLVQSHT